MRIFTCCFHPNGMFLNAESEEEFWLFLGSDIGWGKFRQLRADKEFSPLGGIFGLSELRRADSEPPESVAEGSNVLWRLPEALEVLKQTPSSALQVD